MRAPPTVREYDRLEVLAVMAHPDDAELLCGGVLLRSADLGERTGILDLTRGEAGSKGTAATREAEAEAAARVLGLQVRRNAGLPDAALRNDDDSRKVVATLLRELRPRVVVTHWTVGRHPDHRVAAELVHDACYLAGLRRFDVPGDPHRPFKLVHALSYREDAPRPSFVVDITEQMERKLEALACYPSQFAGASGMGEVYPGGSRSLEDQVRAHAAHYGSLIRTAYGEPFWTRETMLVDSLGTLEVGTF
jgi:N-acetylglucosamine malate deacetylase 1